MAHATPTMALDSRRFKKLLLRSLRSSWDGVLVEVDLEYDRLRRFLGDLRLAFLVLCYTPLDRVRTGWSRLDDVPLPSPLLDNLVNDVKSIYITTFNVTTFNVAAPGYGSKVNATNWMDNSDVWDGVRPFQVRVWLDDSSRLRSKIASRRQQIVRQQSCSLAASAKGWL